MKKVTLSLVFNIIIFLLVTMATIFMFTDFHFMGSAVTLSAKGFSCFKYFTVDSNIFVGIVSLIMAIYEILYLRKKINKIPKPLYILKHMATTAVALTFFVTLIYLGPRIEKGFLSLYTNSNLFFHLIIPVLSMIGYILYDKYDNKFNYSFYSTIPLILYAFYYIPNTLLHMENGKVSMLYDFYGFFYGNPYIVIIVIPLMLLIVFVLASGLYLLNKKLLKK